MLTTFEAAKNILLEAPDGNHENESEEITDSAWK